VKFYQCVANLYPHIFTYLVMIYTHILQNGVNYSSGTHLY